MDADFYLTDEMVESAGMNINSPLSEWIGFKKRVRFSVFERDKGLCFWCEEALTKRTFTVDHIIPRSKGGLYVEDNLVTCCHDCNNMRGSRSAEVFLYMKMEKRNDRPFKDN